MTTNACVDRVVVKEEKVDVQARDFNNNDQNQSNVLIFDKLEGNQYKYNNYIHHF